MELKQQTELTGSAGQETAYLGSNSNNSSSPPISRSPFQSQEEAFKEAVHLPGIPKSLDAGQPWKEENDVRSSPCQREVVAGWTLSTQDSPASMECLLSATAAGLQALI